MKKKGWIGLVDFRHIGKDGLAPEETISSPEVTCEDKDGVDCSSDMISNVSVYEDTQVTYKLKGGTAGATYNIIVKTVTTNNQKLQGKVEIAIS